MKHRWTGALLVAVALSLGACAPAQSGTEGSATPDETAAPASTDPAIATPTATAEPSPTESATAAPTPVVDYEY